MAKTDLRLRIGVLLAAASGSAAVAQTNGDAFMVLGSPTEAPHGFVEMCASDPTFCGQRTEADGGSANLVTGALAGETIATAAPASRVFAAPFVAMKQWAPPVQPVFVAPEILSTSVDVRDRMLSVATPSSLRWLPAHTQNNARQRSLVFGWMGQVPAFAPVPLLSGKTAPVQPAASSESVKDVPNGDELLHRVNKFVNERVAQRTDEQVYGRPEVWHRSGVGRHAAGDCEDIAIEKRYQLIDAGFPPEQLYFAVVYERQVGLHAVLIARVPDGDYVLDSRTPYVKRWDETEYSFVSVQSPTEPMQWHALSEASLHVAKLASTSQTS